MGWLDVPVCRSHRWRWVPTWQSVGFDECWVCGVMGAVRSLLSRPCAVAEADADHFADVGNMVPEPGAQRRSSTRPTSAVAAERARQVLAELALGRKVVDVAEQFGLSKARVYQIKDQARPADVLPPMQRAAAQIAAILEAVDQKRPTSAIAAAFGVSQQRVYQIKSKAKLDRERQPQLQEAGA